MSTELQMLRQQFEQTGKLISAMEAKNKLPKIDFKAIAKAKAGRLEKFAAAIKVDQFKQADDVLKINGWQKLSTSKTGENVYGKKDKPGVQVKVTAGAFSVNHYTEVQHPKSDLSFLETFLTMR